MKNKIFKKPILLATLGYPGSGKTFFSQRFAKDFGLFHLSSDRLRLEIFPHPRYTLSERTVVFRVMDFFADELLRRGVSVIYDANSTKKIYRKHLRDIARRRGADYLLLWFQTPTEVALKRIKKRSNLKSEIMKRYYRTIDNAILFQIKDEEEIPNKEKHLVIKMGSYQKQKELVRKFLRAQK